MEFVLLPDLVLVGEQQLLLLLQPLLQLHLLVGMTHVHFVLERKLHANYNQLHSPLHMSIINIINN